MLVKVRQVFVATDNDKTTSVDIVDICCGVVNTLDSCQLGQRLYAHRAGMG